MLADFEAREVIRLADMEIRLLRRISKQTRLTLALGLPLIVLNIVLVVLHLLKP